MLRGKTVMIVAAVAVAVSMHGAAQNAPPSAQPAGAAEPVQPVQAPPAEAPPANAPTFNKDVAPILFSHCVTCHRPGEVAPMSLLTYTDARPYARAMRLKVLAHDMPPWGADPRYGEFRNKPPLLSDDQIKTIVAWVDAGAPQGDTPLPPAPTFPPNDWNTSLKRPPDKIIDAPIDFEVPARGEVPTFTVWVKVPFNDDKFVEALQLLPSNKRVVHHSSLSLGTLPPKTKLGKAALWDGGPVLDGVPINKEGRPYRAMSGDEFGYPLLFYVPGGGFLRFPQGIAKRIKAGQYFSWGMHYVTDGKPEKVHLQLGLWYARGTVTHEAVTYTANAKRIVDGQEVPVDAHGVAHVPPIPPNDGNYTITGIVGFPDDATLYSLWPHMHFRGRDMTFVLTTPNGKQQILLSVPKYDPNWQVTYELAKPIKIPARSTVAAVAHYDNSASNRNNPNPNQEVIWGPQADNEMFLPFLEVSIDKDDLRLEGFDQRIQ